MMLKYGIERWHYVFIALIVLMKHWLLEAIPFVARMQFIHDDSLFINQAVSIISGEWLGGFSQYVLIKGPIYPLWIAANYYLGLSIIHSQDLLYLVACWVVVKAVSVDFRNKLMVVVIFSFLYLNPVSFNFLSISHGFRMVIYTSLSLMTFGALLGVLLRVKIGNNGLIRWSILFGVSVSLLWYTREEGMWVIPAIVFVFLCSTLVAVWVRNWKEVVRSVVGIIIIPMCLWGALTGVLTYLNWKHYEAPYVVEVMTPNFTRAYNALLSIEPEEFRRYYPVRAKTMEHLLTISSKAAELEAFKGNRDFPAAHFIWAFRHAVEIAGYYDKGAKAVDQYYSDLADELEVLCDGKELKCNKLLLSDMPPWKPIYSEEFIDVLLKHVKELVGFKEFSSDPHGYYSSGDVNFTRAVEKLTHARVQFRKDEVSYSSGTKLFLFDKFKIQILQGVGDIQLMARPFMFYLAIIAMLVILIKNSIQRSYNPYVIFGLSLLGSMLVLTIGLSMIELTAYNSLFRPRHGILPLPPFFILMVLMAVIFQIKAQKNDAK